MNPVIYHNPRCSKSRATLALLQQRGIEPDIVKYLESPPSVDQLREILKQLGKAPPDVIRFHEQAAKDAGIERKDERSEDEWLQLMVSHPVLIERPIVVNNGKARIGRPPENVLEIL